MILYLTQGMAELGLRVKNLPTGDQVISWEDIQLLIEPGQWDSRCHCGPNGSPWILHGCWPGHRTEVDIANFRPDFPVIVYQAERLDDEGRLVFHLDERLWSLPPGRYSGTLRVAPMRGAVYEPVRALRVMTPPPNRGIPPEYFIGRNCNPEFPAPPPPPPRPKCCILSRFDIDLGPQCAEHMVDQVNVEFALTSCGGDE